MATFLQSWSTYWIASGTGTPDSVTDMCGYISVSLESQSIANNTSTISITHYARMYGGTQKSAGSGTPTSTYRANNGSYGGTYQAKSGGPYIIYAGQGYKLFNMGTTTHTVSHNADGTARLYVNGSFSAPSWYGGTTKTSSFNVALPTIPRATTITSFTWAKASGAAGLSTLTCNWATAHSIDRIQYSLNGGAYTTVTGSGTSGSFNISSLTPNTQYSMKIKVRRADSQVETESSTKNATTYDYGKVTGADSINDTGSPYMTFTNPSGAVIDAYIEYGFVNGSATANLKRANISNTGAYLFTLTQGELDAIYAKMPNDPAQTIRYLILTKVDGVETYWNWLDRTFTVVNANPTFTTWTYADTNATTLALTGSNQKIVKGYSNVKATITSANKMVANKGATATSYQLTIGTKPSATVAYSSSSTVEMTVNAVDNNVFNCYAIDSRGNSTNVTKTITTDYINYAPISITSASATRTDDIGEVVTLAYNGTFYNASFGSTTNTIKSATYKYKKTTESTYTDGEAGSITPTPSGNTFSFSGAIKGDKGALGFDATYSYNIQVIVTDELSTKTFTFLLGSGTPNIAISQNGVAINQAYDETLGGALQVNGSVYINSKSLLDMFYPVGTIYETTSSNLDTTTKMANHFGGTWEIYGEGRVLVSLDSSDADFDSVNETGGAKTHTLTVAQMPRHNHTFDSIGKTADWVAPNFVANYQYTDQTPVKIYSDYAGSGAAHNNLQPYIVVYRYRRTA